MELGAEKLLNYIGGEQIFKCFCNTEMGERLKSLGEPLIIRCVLSPKNIENLSDGKLGKIVISSFHRLKNSHAAYIDLGGYQTVPVKPKDIDIRIAQPDSTTGSGYAFCDYSK